jgi:hypothetical protein
MTAKTSFVTRTFVRGPQNHERFLISGGPVHFSPFTNSVRHNSTDHHFITAILSTDHATLPAATLSADPEQLNRRIKVNAFGHVTLPAATLSADPAQLNRRSQVNAFGHVTLPAATLSADPEQLNRRSQVNEFGHVPLPAATLPADPGQQRRPRLVSAVRHAPLPAAALSADPVQLYRRRLNNAVKDCKRKLVFFENFADSLGDNHKDEHFLRQGKVSLHDFHATHRKYSTELREAINAPSSSYETMAFDLTDPSQIYDRVFSKIENHLNPSKATTSVSTRSPESCVFQPRLIETLIHSARPLQCVASVAKAMALQLVMPEDNQIQMLSRSSHLKAKGTILLPRVTNDCKPDYSTLAANKVASSDGTTSFSARFIRVMFGRSTFISTGPPIIIFRPQHLHQRPACNRIIAFKQHWKQQSSYKGAGKFRNRCPPAESVNADPQIRMIATKAFSKAARRNHVRSARCLFLTS